MKERGKGGRDKRVGEREKKKKKRKRGGRENNCMC